MTFVLRTSFQSRAGRVEQIFELSKSRFQFWALLTALCSLHCANRWLLNALCSMGKSKQEKKIYSLLTAHWPRPCLQASAPCFLLFDHPLTRLCSSSFAPWDIKKKPSPDWARAKSVCSVLSAQWSFCSKYLKRRKILLNKSVINTSASYFYYRFYTRIFFRKIYDDWMKKKLMLH